MYSHCGIITDYSIAGVSFYCLITRRQHISCSSTRAFAHGKVALWEVCILCVTSIPTVNHYGYIKKNKTITHDVSRTKL